MVSASTRVSAGVYALGISGSMGLLPRPLTHFHLRPRKARTVQLSRSSLHSILLIRCSPYDNQGYDGWLAIHHGPDPSHTGPCETIAVGRGEQGNKDRSSSHLYKWWCTRSLPRVGQADILNSTLQAQRRAFFQLSSYITAPLYLPSTPSSLDGISSALSVQSIFTHTPIHKHIYTHQFTSAYIYPCL